MKECVKHWGILENRSVLVQVKHWTKRPKIQRDPRVSICHISIMFLGIYGQIRSVTDGDPGPDPAPDPGPDPGIGYSAYTHL